MSRVENTAEDSAPPIRFSLRSALLLNTIVGIILSIPLISVGFALTAGILVTLCLLQWPLFVLFGAFRLDATSIEENYE